MSQQPFPKIFSVFDTVGITLEAFHNYVGTLVGYPGRGEGGGEYTSEQSPKHEVYLGPEDIQKLSFALLASHE